MERGLLDGDGREKGMDEVQGLGEAVRGLGREWRVGCRGGVHSVLAWGGRGGARMLGPEGGVGMECGRSWGRGEGIGGVRSGANGGARA